MKAAANKWTWLCSNKTFTKTCMGQMHPSVVSRFHFTPFTIFDYPQSLASSLDSECGLQTHVIAPSLSQPLFWALCLQLSCRCSESPSTSWSTFCFSSCLLHAPSCAIYFCFPLSSPQVVHSCFAFRSWFRCSCLWETYLDPRVPPHMWSRLAFFTVQGKTVLPLSLTRQGFICCLVLSRV